MFTTLTLNYKLLSKRTHSQKLVKPDIKTTLFIKKNLARSHDRFFTIFSYTNGQVNIPALNPSCGGCHWCQITVDACQWNMWIDFQPKENTFIRFNLLWHTFWGLNKNLERQKRKFFFWILVNFVFLNLERKFNPKSQTHKVNIETCKKSF